MNLCGRVVELVREVGFLGEVNVWRELVVIMVERLMAWS